MDVVQSDIVKFIILILPGLWGLWVYRALCKAGNVEENDLDYGKAVGFGISGYLIGIGGTTSLVCQFTTSTIVTLLIAITLGFLNRHWNIDLAYLPSQLYSRIFKTTIIKPYERGIDVIWQNHIDKHVIGGKQYDKIAVIYSLADPNNKQIGEFLEIPCTNELVIDTRPQMTYDELKSMDDSIPAWYKMVNLDSGIVTEIAIVEKRIEET